MRRVNYPHPVLGYRVFCLGEDGLLYPPGQAEAAWCSGQATVASCERHRHPPRPACGCGLRAYHDPWDAEDCLRGYRLSSGQEDAIIAAVAAWGRMEVRREVFHAQRALVAGILRPDDEKLAARADQAAARYGVPLADTLEELDELARQAARPVPTADRPPGSRSYPAQAGSRIGSRGGRIPVAAVGVVGLVAFFLLLRFVFDLLGAPEWFMLYACIIGFALMLLTVLAYGERSG